ncbi:hypothetical protein LCGC14_1154960 [marine sediment metagenome]|uniref:FCP1 homology domain-containing protein n=1 Tax=marine sediment metagenome TaxID=412755 RepID=A0A0F9PZV2_9ZZZZ|nr:hypothetical protein [bacterium]
MREVYIFDIDGCVMSPIFPDFNNNESREKVVGDAVHNGNGIKLFPDFVKYYKKYCTQAESIFFITGRKRSEFGKLTNKHLLPLVNIKKFSVIYYPEAKPHKIRKYFNWKAKKIKAIIKSTTNKKDINIAKKVNYIFNIFDDLNDYFLKIRRYKDKQDVQIRLTLIEDENSWNQFLQ